MDENTIKALFDGDPFAECPYSLRCGSCVHMRDYSRHTCAAFPDGIPFAVWCGQHDHTQPYEGDGGIRYERKPKEDGS